MIPQASASVRRVAVPSTDAGTPSATLINAYSTRNLGDAAIMRCLAALVPGSGPVQVALSKTNEFAIPGVRFAEASKGGIRISVGGDIFNNSRPHFITRNFLNKLAELSRARSSTIAFGQTIPASCRGIAFALLTRVLRGLPAVVVRDTESLMALRAAGVAAELSWDAAFITELLVDAVWRAHALLAESNLRADHTAVISVRPFDAMYPTDQAAFETSLAELARGLLARGHDVALLIQSDVGTWDEDRTTATRIAAADARIKIIDCLSNSEDPDPVATLTALLSVVNIAIGVRYHTTVLRLAAGRQPFNLFYSRKGLDLQRRLGLAGCHVSEMASRDCVEAAEKTAGGVFDPDPIRRDVRDHFTAALEAVSA